jgi:hypothetical protein
MDGVVVLASVVVLMGLVGVERVIDTLLEEQGVEVIIIQKSTTMIMTLINTMKM